MQAMPQPAMRIDTGTTTPGQAADAIIEMMKTTRRTTSAS
jgi:hypothetical protein